MIDLLTPHFKKRWRQKSIAKQPAEKNHRLNVKACINFCINFVVDDHDVSTWNL
jgi:hypothetical protein